MAKFTDKTCLVIQEIKGKCNELGQFIDSKRDLISEFRLILK